VVISFPLTEVDDDVLGDQYASITDDYQQPGFGPPKYLNLDLKKFQFGKDGPLKYRLF
jgi:hypothetical protein